MIKSSFKKIAISFTCLLLILLCFSSCGAKIKLEFESGQLVSNKDVKYTPAPMAYKPRRYIADDKYATLKHPIYGKINLYEVEGTNGGWLYCPTDDTLYRISSVGVPTLEMMAPTSALISTNGDKELSLATLEDKDVVAAMAKLVESGEKGAVEDTGYIPSKVYKLSFISEDYPHLLYSITYYEYSDGTYRLYDRDSMLYFEIGDEIHTLLNGSETTN